MNEILSRVVRCRELLEDGDLWTLGAVLADLEHDLAAQGPERPRDLACSRCLARFHFPGERDDHERLVHFEEAA